MSRPPYAYAFLTQAAAEKEAKVAEEKYWQAMEAIRDSGGDSSPTMATTAPADAGALRALVDAQRRELASQHSDLSRLQTQLSVAETERVKLARLVAGLTTERDQYLSGLTEASQRLTAMREAAADAEQLHLRDRKDDTALFQQNLQRLLLEKAQLHEEVEATSGQKDALTEALATAAQPAGPYMHTCTHTHMHTCTHTHMHTYTDTQMRTIIHTCVCVQALVQANNQLAGLRQLEEVKE